MDSAFWQLLQSHTARRTKLDRFGHQKSDPKQRKTEEQQNNEHDPSACRDLASHDWRRTGLAERTTELWDRRIRIGLYRIAGGTLRLIVKWWRHK